MKRAILYSIIALGSICASAQEYKYTLNPVFCSLGDTVYTPLDTVLFAFDHEVFDALDPYIAAPCVYIKTSSITKDGIETNAGDAIKYWNKYEKGYVLVKYDLYSSAILPKGDYRLHLIKGVINAKKEEYVLNDDFYMNFTIPEDLGCGKATFSGDTISEAIYDKLRINFPTDIKVTGSDNYLILNQEWKEPIKIPFGVYKHCLYADLNEKMYFDDGVKYTLTLPAGSVSAKYRDDIVNLETCIDFVGGYKSDSKLIPISCSLTDTVCEPINTVTFTFDQEVTCTDAEFIHAYIYCDGSEVASGNASYSFFSDENRDKTKAVLDISPKPFVPEKGKSYRLHVHSGVFVSIDEESSKWNEDIYVDFVGGDISGVENAEAEIVSVACVNGLLTVTGIDAGTEVTIFSVDGKAVANMITGSTAVEIPLPAKGIYLVTVNSKSFKVIN